MNSFFAHLLSRVSRFYIDMTDNSPATVKDFMWKVRWRINHDYNPVFIEIQDKYRVKEYASRRGVMTPETYYVTDNPTSIPFDTLPDNYFIKANHGCEWNILCRDKKLYYYKNGRDFGGGDYSEFELSQEECIVLCDSWLRKVYSHREWVYTKIPPRILVEEALTSKDGGELKDYRFYTFHGKVKMINVRTPAYRHNGENIFLDENWNEFKLTVYKEKRPLVLPEKPLQLEKMVAIAEKLGKDLDFVRIDLYDTARGVLLGEMTVYPYGGLSNNPTACPVFNKWLGDCWDLPT